MESALNKNFLISWRSDGLGGRFHNFLWSWRASLLLNRRLLVYWPRAKSVVRAHFGEDYRVSNIFDLRVLYEKFEQPPIFIEQDEDNIDIKNATMMSVSQKGRRCIDLDEYRRIDTIIGNTSYLPILDGDENEDIARADISQLFSSIPTHPKIDKILSEITRNIDLDASIGLHFRRGDIISSLNSSSKIFLDDNKADALYKYSQFYFRKCAPKAAYVRAAQQFLTTDDNVDKKGKKIVVFSDDPNGVSKIKNSFEDGVVYDLREYFKNLLPIQLAFLEMLLMSKCNAIFSTASGFSQSAELLSGKKAVSVQEFANIHEIAKDYLSIIEIKSKTPSQIVKIGQFLQENLPSMRISSTRGRRKDGKKSIDVFKAQILSLTGVSIDSPL